MQHSRPHIRKSVFLYRNGILSQTRILVKSFDEFSFDILFLSAHCNEHSSFHLFFRSLQEKTSQDGSVDEEERERGSGLIEEKETSPANPALCAFTAAL